MVKVYHQPTPERARKLEAMLANTPDDPMAAQGHTSIAWPVDLLIADGAPKCVVGFLMPRVDGMRRSSTSTTPRPGGTSAPCSITSIWHYTARNVAAAVGALHARG